MLLNLPFALPDWMPAWIFLVLALPVLLWALAFLLMPFSVFGVKARLESLEEQIDSLHEDLRMMTLRASGGLPPAPSEFSPYDEIPNFSRLKKSPTVYPAAHEEPVMPPPRPVHPAPRPADPVPRTAPVVYPRERLSPSPAPAPAPAPKPFRRTEPRLD
ncbi:hypothetical protein GCM10010909_25970 [Acidocella aquatica]|uniref:Uncharacterized protein n=1 Tax=Acidocella aquatica TaxID=1922313 RepID=A0ABQ6A7R0_9PROT|nr:hypothetical protein [Acidocella aquatica]GLR67916.1 hypothetical protein GCM10010909_25970 [Acidocella aquatica]